MIQFFLMLFSLAFPSNDNAVSASDNNTPISIQSDEADGTEDIGGETGQIPPKWPK